MADLEGVRKLEAILAADVVGYSRLMQGDDEATVRALEDSRAVFREHIVAGHGRVIDMAGDSVLAVFHSATGAVRAAVAIQHTLAAKNEPLPDARRMRFRIGVNLGEVIERPDGTVYGDGVNVAARLESLGEPGGVIISASVFEQIKNRVALEFEPIGAQRVKNIAESINAYRVVGKGAVRTVSHRRVRRLRLALAACLFVIAVGTGIYIYVKSHLDPAPGGGARLTLPDKPSIAVLPFVNMSQDPEQEYFSDGMTEEVITSLSKRPGLFVIARNSVFTYKGKAVKPEQVSRELGVRYVLEGSVRKADHRVRITAQLIDGQNGGHLWAEHYDGELKDIFALQDGVTQKIVAALSPRLSAESQAKGAARPETVSVEAYDLLLRGVSLRNQVKRESRPLARQFFERAIVLDPNYANAYAALAWIYIDEWSFLWSQDPQTLARALEVARRAVELDPDLAEGRRALGYALLWSKRYDECQPQLKTAVELDPNSANALGTLASCLNYLGRPAEAIEYVRQAMRVDPKYGPWVVLWLGDSYYLLRRYDDALAAYEEAKVRNPNYISPHRSLAAIYAELGRQKDAEAEAAEVMRINPQFSLETYRARLPFKNPQDLDRFTGALRKAGLK